MRNPTVLISALWRQHALVTLSVFQSQQMQVLDLDRSSSTAVDVDRLTAAILGDLVEETLQLREPALSTQVPAREAREVRVDFYGYRRPPVTRRFVANALVEKLHW